MSENEEKRYVEETEFDQLKLELREALKDQLDALKAIARNTQTSRFHLIGIITVGTDAVQLPRFRAEHGVILKGLNANTDTIHVANHDTVATAGEMGIGGFEIGPGQAPTVPIRILEDFWAISDSQTQYLSIWAS